MIQRVGILAALLLAACAGDDGARNIVPAEEGFPVGKWKGDFLATEEPRSLFMGVRKVGEEYAVVFEVGPGPAVSVPAQLEAETLVLDAFSLQDSASSCRWNSFDFPKLALRLEDGRLVGEANTLYTTHDDGTLAGGASTAVFAGAPYDGAPAPFFVDTADWWLSPGGIFTNTATEPVLLPAEATIHVGGERIPGYVAGAGTYGTSLVITPARALPWADSAEVRVEVEDTTGAPHTISWATPMVAAPTATPDPFLTSLDGYLAGAGVRLSPADAIELIGREGGFAGYFGNAWVLGFETDVPDTTSAHLEIDLVFVAFDEGRTPGEPVVVTVASDSTRRAAPLVIEETTVRPPSDRSGWKQVEDIGIRIDLAEFRGQRVFVHVADPGRQACAEPSSGMTVLDRIEVLP